MSSLFNALLFEYRLLLMVRFFIWFASKLLFQMFLGDSFCSGRWKGLWGKRNINQNWNNKAHQSSTIAPNYHISVCNCLYFQVWMRCTTNHRTYTLTDMTALPFEALCASFEAWWMQALSPAFSFFLLSLSLFLSNSLRQEHSKEYTATISVHFFPLLAALSFPPLFD